jgi:acyl-CoA thioester hydrolase
VHAKPYRHRVLYGDTDQMGVVYYGNYLRFFEGARNEWIRGLGLSYAQIESRGIMLPVMDVQVRYLRPARYDDLLEIPVSVTHTRVRIRFDYVVHRAGEAAALCQGHTVHACVNKEGRPTRGPEWLIEALKPGLARVETLARFPAEGD